MDHLVIYQLHFNYFPCVTCNYICIECLLLENVSFLITRYKLALLSRFRLEKVPPGTILLISSRAHFLFSFKLLLRCHLIKGAFLDQAAKNSNSLSLHPTPQTPCPLFHIQRLSVVFLTVSYYKLTFLFLPVCFCFTYFQFLLEHKFYEDRNVVSFMYCCISCAWHSTGSFLHIYLFILFLLFYFLLFFY